MTDDQQTQPDAPKELFRVTSGDLTPEELAALTVVLAAAASGDDEDAPVARSTWSTPARQMRSIGIPGPSAWRAEYAPR